MKQGHANHANALDIIRRHTIGDGYPFLVSPQDSHMSWLADTAGRRYLDCVSQYASQPLGWNHPALARLEHDTHHLVKHKLANSDFYSVEKAQFVHDIASVLPDFKYFFFVEGGSLAVENALKVAFDWKAQKLECDHDAHPEFDVIHLEGAFHGRSGYSLSLTNTTPDKTRWFPRFNWTRIPAPYLGVEDQRKVEEDALAKAWHAMTKNNTAAVIMEPIQGEGGDRHFTARFFTMLREMCDETDTLLIFDEVQTGLGMTGKMWAYQHYGVIPDILAFAKKTQVGGIAVSDRIDEVDHVFRIGSRINSTWGGNIIDMARFSAIKRGIEDYNLLDSVNKVGEKLIAGLKELPAISNVRGLGLMVAFDLDTAEERNDVLDRMEQNMLALKCGRKSIRLRPHLSFSEHDAELACAYIDKAVTCSRSSALAA